MQNPQEALYNPQITSAADLIVYGMGTRTEHPPDLVSRTPRFDGHLFMCFRNSFFCTTDEGIVSGKAGDCIIHPPHYKQEHGTCPGSDEGFINDWISVHWGHIPTLLTEYQLPLNTVLPTGAPSLMEPFLTKIHFEIYDDAPFAPRAIAAQLELLILEMARSRSRTAQAGNLSRTEIEIRNRLIDVRVQVHQHINRHWTVADMAQLAHLSPGYFATRYREFIGISPLDDLLSRRVDLAKRLLLQQDYEISVIADRCGFSDIYYFSRVFKQRVGTPPAAYRRLMNTASRNTST